MSDSRHLGSICVFAGSRPGTSDLYGNAAQKLGEALTRNKIDLVFGGGKVGLMGILADAVLSGGGRVTGVIPDALMKREVAHTQLTELVIVDSMHTRKATMAERSDAFIALPGGMGTLEELFEVLTWKQLGLHNKPCGLINVDGYYDALLALLDESVNRGFVKAMHRKILLDDTNPDRLIQRLRTVELEPDRKWIDESQS
ncbi:MAG: TIGR00730 family Rossman fold protein [Rhodothermales bacterium]|nr:TIGR00730 family Rossman fold protein [Rhodothermales bacterium]